MLRSQPPDLQLVKKTGTPLARTTISLSPMHKQYDPLATFPCAAFLSPFVLDRNSTAELGFEC